MLITLRIFVNINDISKNKPNNTFLAYENKLEYENYDDENIENDEDKYDYPYLLEEFIPIVIGPVMKYNNIDKFIPEKMWSVEYNEIIDPIKKITKSVNNTIEDKDANNNNDKNKSVMITMTLYHDNNVDKNINVNNTDNLNTKKLNELYLSYSNDKYDIHNKVWFSRMNLAIVGSRDYTNYHEFSKITSNFIKKYGKPDIIISGGAKGADSLAKEYAKQHNIPIKEFLPDWSKGLSAGPIRNSLIINNSTHVIAFPSRKGKGTQDSIKKTKNNNLKNIPLEIHYID